MLCNFMGYFYRVKKNWNRYLETSLILRGTVKNVALELRPKVKGGSFIVFGQFLSLTLTGSTIASISGWFYGDFKMQWSCQWCLMVTKTSGKLAATETRVLSESTATATPAPANCSGRVWKYSSCSFSGLRTELSFGANFEISFILEHILCTRSLSNSRIQV